MAVSFEKANNLLGIDAGGLTFGNAWGDYNGDDLPDLWVHSHYRNDSILYSNQGSTFTGVTFEVFSDPTTLEDDNHGTAWADFDNDGDLDLTQLVSGENAGTSLAPDSQPNRIYVNENGVLIDRADELGLSYDSATAQSPLWVDYNNDGLLDLVHISGGRADGLFPTTVFRQRNNGTFEDVGASVAPQLRSSGQRLGNLADINGDGNLDLLVEGTRFILDLTTEPFTDITNSVGGGGGAIDAITADFNGDLLTDVYLTRKRRSPELGQRNSNNVRGFFQANNSEEGASFTATGELDFITTYLPAERIYIGASGFNPTDSSFTLSSDDSNVRGLAPRSEPGAYIGYDPISQTWRAVSYSPNQNRFALDVNSDNPITEVSAIGFDGNPSPPGDTLLINSDNGLINRSAASGITDLEISGNSVTAGDFDNDMDVDIYIIATGSVLNQENVFLDNQGDGTFVSIPNAGGAAGSSLGLGDSVTMADYDLDGFLDLFVTNGYVEGTPLFSEEGPYELFRNQGNSNNWLQIDLQGVQSNRDGIGAQVFVTAGGVTQLREQSGGFHKWSQNHQRIHFGLAENTQVDLLEIRWPSGTVQQIENIAANQLIEVVEDTTTITPGGINGTEGSDTLRGSGEDDLINGLGSRDVLRGFAGNDTLNGNEGNDNLLGGFNSDVLDGDEGNDLLIGGFGNDTLIGGSGRDRFRWSRADDGIDEISDFNSSEDTLQVDGSDFGGLANGAIANSQFVLGNTAVDSNDRFIYNQSNGNLFFDPDGVGGEEQVQLATLSNSADLSADDIVVF